MKTHETVLGNVLKARTATQNSEKGTKESRN